MLYSFTAGSCTLTLQLCFLRPHAGKRDLELLSQRLQHLYGVAAYGPLTKRVLAEETRILADEARVGLEGARVRGYAVVSQFTSIVIVTDTSNVPMIAS